MTDDPRFELAIPASGLARRTRDFLLELITRVPESSELRMADAREPRWQRGTVRNVHR